MRSFRAVIRIVGLAAVLALMLVGGPPALAQTNLATPRVAPVAATTAAAQPSRTPTFWGWVTLRDPNAIVQPVGPYDQGNALGGTNSVSHDGPGFYHVIFPLVGTGGGIVNVTVLGTEQRVCDVSTWDDFPLTVAGGGTDENVYILCWNDAGTPASAAFVATYSESAKIGGRLAYVWAGDWTRTNYTPDTRWNFNSTGSPNKIHRNRVGDYSVTLPGLASSKGDVQIGNYGRFAPGALAAVRPSGISPQTPTECNVASWARHSTAMRVHVLCRDLQGHPVNTQFNLTFTQREGLKGPNGTDVAYLRANHPTAHRYTPISSYRYSSPSGAPRITRTAKGRYTVSLPGMPKGGAAIVTARGSGKVRCDLASINTAGHPEQMGVRCRNFSGHAVDSEFTLSYLR